MPLEHGLTAPPPHRTSILITSRSTLGCKSPAPFASVGTMSFGWSVGDIVSAIDLLVKFGKALREVDRAKSDFQDATETLTSLEITLSFLKEQYELEEKACKAAGFSARSARTAVLRTQVELIQKPVSRFLDEAEKYDKKLGVSSSKHVLSGIPRKSKWAFYLAEKVRKLHADIATPLSTIGLLQHQITM
jgi:hypothetical protein